jgi:hypothetical protein
MEKLTDPYGFPYYPTLPEGFRGATIDDFHIKGSPNIGKEYLIKSVLRENMYEIYFINRKLSSTFLIPFIRDGRVFIKINGK